MESLSTLAEVEVNNINSKVSNKIKTFEEVTLILNRLNETKKIVQCHGVFDLLHIGHIRHFQRAKAMGDVLVISITPDRFVNKGPGRPVFSEQLRAEAIAALDFTDYVIINEWPTAVEAIKLIKPNLYVKGAEYQIKDNDITGKIDDEEQAVLSLGGKIAFTEDITFSSSTLLNEYFPSFSPAVTNYLKHFKRKFSTPDILKYLINAKDLKVLVVGEAIIDEYNFCTAIGKAGKEPVLVAKHESVECYAGGILAVANHIADFCKEVVCYTYFGETGEYEHFARGQLKQNVQLIPIYKKASPTLVKRRYLDQYMGQKLFEIYEINDEPLSTDQEEEFIKQLTAIIPTVDVVIVADYGHGFLEKEAVKVLTTQSKFLAVNTQANAGNHGFNCISKYPTADYVSIAQRELDLTFRQRNKVPKEHLERLIKDFSYQNIMVTSGRCGSLTYKSGEEIAEVPAFANHVRDRVGAGDSVLAITSLCVAQNAPAEIIGFIGNVVGAEAVSIMGNERYIEKIPLMKHITHLLK